METCIFCQIAARKAPASIVYEDEQVMAFLDIDQPNDYEVLLIPRQHVEDIYSMEDVLAAHILPVAVRIARAIRAASGCEGLGIFQASGSAAGQEVFHFHLHLTPRNSNDSYRFHWQRRYPPRADLDRMAETIRANL